MVEKITLGKEKILRVLREADSDLEHDKKWLSNEEIVQKVGHHKSIVCKYLRELITNGQIEKGPGKHWRKYGISNMGREILEKKDIILMISRSKKIIEKEISPDSKRLAPRILPINVAVYSSPEIDKLRNLLKDELEFTKEFPLSQKYLDEIILADIAEPIAAHFEYQLMKKFYDFDRKLLVFKIKQMDSKKRRNFLKKLHKYELPLGKGTAIQSKVDNKLDKIEKEYTSQEFPLGPPSFDNLLDFEEYALVSISKERIIKDKEKIRNRLTAFLINAILNLDFAPPPYFFETMKQLGMITDDEYKKRLRTRSKKQHEKLLKELSKKYYTLSYGESHNRIFKDDMKSP